MSGDALFPHGVSREIVLMSQMSQVGGVLEAGMSAMGAVPASTSAPSGDEFSVSSPMSWDGNIVEILDDVEEALCSLTPGQVGRENVSLVDAKDVNLMCTNEADGGAVQPGNSQPGGSGPQAVTGGPPRAAGDSRQGLRGTQRASPQAQAPALQTAPNNTRNPLLNKGWEDVAARMAIISLQAAGRPYKRINIEQALVATGMDCSTIVTLGEFANNFKWQITFATQGTADYFIRNFPSLAVTTENGTFDCSVSSFLRREYRVKVAWFPDAGTDQEIAQAMSQWGEVLAIHREKVRGVFGSYFSGVRIVTLVPSNDIDDIPDFADMRANGRLYTVRMTIIGLKARCHNCQRRGHLARECEACGRCGSAEHATADHPHDIPFTTFADRVSGRRRRAPPAYAPGEMDVDMASGDGNQEKAPRRTKVTVNSLIQERLAARADASNDGSESAQRPFIDAAGFEVPKDHRDKAKRRRGRVGQTPNSVSENDSVMPAIVERDEEVSDSETSEARSKLPRTERSQSQMESPQLMEESRGVGGGDGGLVESQPPPPAPPEGQIPEGESSGENRGEGGGGGRINILPAPFSL